jgi:hypothetical protein
MQNRDYPNPLPQALRNSPPPILDFYRVWIKILASGDRGAHLPASFATRPLQLFIKVVKGAPAFARRILKGSVSLFHRRGGYSCLSLRIAAELLKTHLNGFRRIHIGIARSPL